MSKKLIVLLVLIVFILSIWLLYSVLSVHNIKKPQYSLTSIENGYEIRNYESYIIAETTITGVDNVNEAMSKGFPIIAGYIFGDNTTQNNIAMTAPVSVEAQSEKIAMTTPVISQEKQSKGSYRFYFIMPENYTLDTLPKPNDARVLLKKMPSHNVAVKKFSWTNSSEAFKNKQTELLNDLSRDKVTVKGNVIIARYNPPWTVPFLLRNEVQFEIE